MRTNSAAPALCTKWSDPNKRSSFFGTFSYYVLHAGCAAVAGPARSPLISAASSAAIPFQLKSPPPVAAKVAPGGVRATANGTAITFWWVSDLPGASWAEVPEGTLVGAVKLDADGKDIRGHVIKAGVYTLRYGIQPANDDHFGISPFRNFLLLSPAAVDKDPAAVDHDGVIALEADPWW